MASRAGTASSTPVAAAAPPRAAAPRSKQAAIILHGLREVLTSDDVGAKLPVRREQLDGATREQKVASDKLLQVLERTKASVGPAASLGSAASWLDPTEDVPRAADGSIGARSAPPRGNPPSSDVVAVSVRTAEAAHAVPTAAEGTAGAAAEGAEGSGGFWPGAHKPGFLAPIQALLRGGTSAPAEAATPSAADPVPHPPVDESGDASDGSGSAGAVERETEGAAGTGVEEGKEEGADGPSVGGDSVLSDALQAAISPVQTALRLLMALAEKQEKSAKPAGRQRRAATVPAEGGGEAAPMSSPELAGAVEYDIATDWEERRDDVASWLGDLKVLESAMAELKQDVVAKQDELRRMDAEVEGTLARLTKADMEATEAYHLVWSARRRQVVIVVFIAIVVFVIVISTGVKLTR